MQELQEMKRILLENPGVAGLRELVEQVDAKVDAIQRLRGRELSQSQLVCQNDTQRALDEVRAQIQAL